MTGTAQKSSKGQMIWDRMGVLVQRWSTWIIIITLLLTGFMFFPLIFMAPDERASSEPGGEVFELSDTMDREFPPTVHHMGVIIEAKGDDMLTQEVLWELYQNEEELRNSDIGNDFLYNRYDVETERMIMGVYTIADAVQSHLIGAFNITLEQASDDQVKLALDGIFKAPRTEAMARRLSVDAANVTRNVLGREINYWTAKACTISINSDNMKIVNNYSKTLENDPGEEKAKEHYCREVQEYIRGDQRTYRAWGIAIDVSLEAEEEGFMSFPMIMGAILLIIIIISIQFRSFSVTALTTIGIFMLIIWLKGFSNLVGLRSSLTLDIIVPVAILVLGVDYIIHALHRYNEEKGKGAEPGEALRNSVAGVGGALFLAMITTFVAFASNAISGIEEIVGFGIASGMAIVFSFVIMGFFIPSMKMKWDTWWEGRNKERPEKKKKVHRESVRLSRVVVFLAKKRAVVLPVILVISLCSIYFAFQLEAKMDVKEYFDSESDFVVSLDKLDEHVGDKGGEPALLYIRGDLNEPEALEAMKQLESNMQDDTYVARDQYDHSVNLNMEILQFLEAILKSELAISRIEIANPGLEITDEDNDLIPDDAEQNRAIFDYILANGIPLNETVLRYEPSRIGEVLYKDPVDGEYSTKLWIGVPGTREQQAIRDSRAEFDEDMKALDVEAISYYGVTGSPYERDETLTAITNSLSLSIIVAVVLCFIVLLLVLRSFKYAIITVIPEILVAAWLYAFMYLGGFHLNAVTATIAAISIGVGIDYSVHITVRFRQEMRKTKDRLEALDRTARNSGGALFGSAASTMFGFAIIAFAPMPMFSSFGLLTALMIAMAFVAALFVLPSLLIIAEGSKGSNT